MKEKKNWNENLHPWQRMTVLNKMITLTELWKWNEIKRKEKKKKEAKHSHTAPCTRCEKCEKKTFIDQLSTVQYVLCITGTVQTMNTDEI